MKKTSAKRNWYRVLGTIAFITVALQLMACDFVTYSDTEATIEFTGTYLVPKTKPKKQTNQPIIFAGGWGKNGQSVQEQSEYGLSLQTPLFTLTAEKPDPNAKKWDPTLGKTTHKAYLEEFFKNRWDWKTITASSSSNDRKMLQTKCELSFNVNDFVGAGTKNQWAIDHIYDTTVLIEKYYMFVIDDTGIFETVAHYSFNIIVDLGNYHYDSIAVKFEGSDGGDVFVQGF